MFHMMPDKKAQPNSLVGLKNKLTTVLLTLYQECSIQR